MSDNQSHVPGPYTWQESYACGIARIDRQHRRLLELANLLQITLDKHFDSAIVEEALQALIWYTDTHFRDEERELERLGSPHLEAQKKAHHRLSEEIQEFAVDMALGADTDSTQRFREWINNRLILHIIESDNTAFKDANSSES